MARLTFEAVSKIFQLLNLTLTKGTNKTYRCDGYIFQDLQKAMEWLAKPKKEKQVKPLSEKEILKAKEQKANADLILHKIEDCSDYYFISRRIIYQDKDDYGLDQHQYLLEGIRVRLEGLYPNYKVSGYQYFLTSVQASDEEFTCFENEIIKPEHSEKIYKFLQYCNPLPASEYENVESFYPDILIYCEQAVNKAIMHQAVASYKFSCHNYLVQIGIRCSRVLSVKLINGKAYVTYRLVNGKNGSTILSMRKCNPMMVKSGHINFIPVIDQYKMTLDHHYFAIAGWEIIKNDEKFCFVTANSNAEGWLRFDERHAVTDLKPYSIETDPDKVHPYQPNNCWYDAMFALNPELLALEKTVINRNPSHDALAVVTAVANAYTQGNSYRVSQSHVEYPARKIFLSDVDCFASGVGFVKK